MKLTFAKDFCIWVVPSRDGRVRKLRLTLGLLSFVLLSMVFVGGMFAFIAGDYARVQILRAKHYLMLQHVVGERDKLLASQQTMATETESLKSTNSKRAIYEKSVRDRLDELAAVVEAATSLELMRGQTDKRSSSQLPKIDNGGIGGAEIECEGIECETIVMEPDAVRASLSSHALEQPGLEFDRSNQDLVELLDGYIEVLKTLPLGVPGMGHINSAYGYRRSPFSGRVTMHEGIDISLPLGSYIYATADGVVSDVGRNSTYGLMIDLSHGQRVVSRYAHLSKVLVTEGEKICRGEVLGLVGSTGHSTGPHLHYEIRTNGRALNPKPYIDLVGRLKRLL